LADLDPVVRAVAERRQALVDIMRGVPAYKVMRALNTLTPGLDWRGCGKGAVADEFSRGTSFWRELHMIPIDKIREAIDKVR